MATLSESIVRRFCEVCDWAHSVWSMHHTFDEDPRTPLLMRGDLGPFLHTYSIVSMEYTLLQLAKLHDAASQGSRQNLSLDYILYEGGWDPITHARLKALSTELNELYSRIRAARHRIIAHNDLRTLLSDQDLGHFPAGLDVAYFEALEQFAAAVYSKVTGESYQFAEHAHTDVLVLLRVLAGPGSPDTAAG